MVSVLASPFQAKLSVEEKTWGELAKYGKVIVELIEITHQECPLVNAESIAASLKAVREFGNDVLHAGSKGTPTSDAAQRMNDVYAKHLPNLLENLLPVAVLR